MSTDAQQLDYTGRLEWHQRRRFQRRLILLAILAAALPAIVLGFRWVYNRSYGYRVQRPCLAYVAAPSQVVYEEDEARAGQLFAEDDRYVTYSALRPDKWASERAPAELVGVGYVPDCWRAYPVKFGDTLRPVLFLHRRTTRRGTSRLVYVAFEQWMTSDVEQPLKLQVASWQVASFTGGINSWGTHEGNIPLKRRGDGDSLRFYAGQPDATDVSHFTIRYEINGKPRTIDGWLEDSDRTSTPAIVRLAIREPSSQ